MDRLGIARFASSRFFVAFGCGALSKQASLIAGSEAGCFIVMILKRRKKKLGCLSLFIVVLSYSQAILHKLPFLAKSPWDKLAADETLFNFANPL